MKKKIIVSKEHHQRKKHKTSSTTTILHNHCERKSNLYHNIHIFHPANLAHYLNDRDMMNKRCFIDLLWFHKS